MRYFLKRWLLLCIVVTPLRWGLAKYVAAQTERVPCKGNKSPDAKILLALNPSRFRGDLEILSNDEHIKVVKAPFAVQATFVQAFYPKSERTQEQIKARGAITRHQKTMRFFFTTLFASLL